MLTLPHPVRRVLTTMAHADPRLSRLVGQLACALIVMSLVMAALGCVPMTRIANEDLDQAALLLFALLLVLYWSGKRTQAAQAIPFHRPFVLILFSLLSTSSAVKLADTQFTLSANPQQGFKLLTWLTLAPEFPKDARLIVAEFACNVNKDGALRFRHLNLPQYIWGDDADEKAVAQQFLNKTQLRIGPVTASCDGGKLIVQVTTPAKLATAFPDTALSAAEMELRRNLDISPDVTFGAGGLRVMRVPFALKGKVLSTPETASGVAMGVTQFGVLKPLANGTRAMPVNIQPALPYTLHVIAGKSYNLTVSGSQLTGWVSDRP